MLYLDLGGPKKGGPFFFVTDVPLAVGGYGV